MHQKKQRFILIIILSLFLSGHHNAYCQQNNNSNDVNNILRIVSAKTGSLKSVSYKYQIELLYSEENYHNTYTINSYIDFNPGDNMVGCRFQAEEDGGFSCYNGAHYFGLDKKNKTIDIQEHPDSSLFERLTALNNSMVTLRAFIPTLLQNDVIKKTITDTVINKEGFYVIKFELYNQYLESLGSLKKIEKEYTGSKYKPYELVISKKTLLPFQFITKFKDRNKDFIAVTFLNLDTDPTPPKELSWLYSTYKNEYTSPKPEKPLITKGTMPENWVLPFYNGNKIDSTSLYEYRGKIVMLDFWIKSCGPCIASFPHLNKLQKKFDTDKFQLLSVNAEDKIQDIEFFYKKNKPVYKMLFGGDSLAKNYGIPGFPTIVIIDKSGKVIYNKGFDKVEIEKIIQQNL